MSATVAHINSALVAEARKRHPSAALPDINAWHDLLDFVEQHGGALSGEKRIELRRLAVSVKNN